MSDFLQVTTPVAPKNYNLTAKPIVQTDEIFDLVDLSKVIKTADRTEQFTQQDQTFEEDAGAIRKLPMLIAKDPSLTANSLKALLSSEVVNQLTESGNVELLNKLNELAGEIVLSPGDVLTDLKAQLNSTTMFNGDLFNMLRTLAAQTTNPDIKNAVINLLKAAVNASAGQEILNSLSANLKFLAEQLSPSKALSANLQDLSNQLKSANAGENFASIRTQILNILPEVNGSLLLTDKLRSLIPLITHNLSRFNDSPTAMKDSFSNLADLLSNKDLKAVLTKSFNEYVQNSDISQGIKLQVLMPAAGSELAQKLADQALIQDSVSKLAEQLNTAGSQINADALQKSLFTISTLNGTGSLKEVLMQLLPNSSGEMLDKVLGNFTQTKDLNQLLDQLSTILNRIDSIAVKVVLAEKLNEVLSHLATSENISYKPPSSMENLVDFLSKNINDAGLRSLNAFNQNEMVQSLLTAPGVFTPLLHYLIPVQVEDTRAFGELWVDNDAGGNGSSGSDENGNHMFLSFSIENIGDFELELYTKSTEISIALMCPQELIKSFSNMKDTIAKIAVSNGYSPKNTVIDVLKDKRTLVDVFSRIKEKRVGLNVKA